MSGNIFGSFANKGFLTIGTRPRSGPPPSSISGTREAMRDEYGSAVMIRASRSRGRPFLLEEGWLSTTFSRFQPGLPLTSALWRISRSHPR